MSVERIDVTEVEGIDEAVVVNKVVIIKSCHDNSGNE